MNFSFHLLPVLGFFNCCVISARDCKTGGTRAQAIKSSYRESDKAII